MAMDTNQNQSYYAVIPATVRYSKEVCDGAKLLYAEITSLCNKEGFCWAKNAYFAELYSKSPDTISRWISELARAGFILTLVDSADGNSRKIWLSETQGIGKNAERVSAKIQRGYRQKYREGIGKNAEYNNKVNNKENTTTETAAGADKITTLKAEKNNPSPDPPPPSPSAPGESSERRYAERYDLFDIDLEAAILKEDFRCHERFASVFSCDVATASQKIRGAVDEFVLDQKAVTYNYNSTKDFRSHFFNWLPKKAMVKRAAQKPNQPQQIAFK